METSLPEEIVEIILCHENVSISDVVNFSLTNKYYYNVIRNSNTVWKKKYFEIWPQFSKLFENHDPDFCWYDEVLYVYNLKRRTRQIIYTMSKRLYKYYQLFGPNFSKWMKLYEETPRTYYYLIHDLKKIVNTQAAINTIEVVPISTPGNKTLQYYAKKVLRYLLCSRLMDELHGRLPLRPQTLETAIVFVIQWVRPSFDVSWKDIIPNKFDELAEKVKEHLKVIHPNHPLFAVPEEDLKVWREEEIDGNKYDAENCQKVVQALESVLAIVIDSGFRITILQENNLIEKLAATNLVAVYGEYTSLLLTYQCVARRLGLKYEIILSNDRKRYVLWISSNFSNAIEDMLPIARTEQFDPIKAIYQYCFLCGNWEQSADLEFLELLQALSPLNVSAKIFMRKCYLDQSFYFNTFLVHRVISERIKDPRSVKLEMLKLLKEERMGSKRIVKDSRKVRPPNLKYAVGMVMEDVTTWIKCVIYDWDPTCAHGWQPKYENNLDLQELKRNQPFYKVLGQFGWYEYIPQDYLEPSSDTASLLTLKEIGRHFSHVFETHFVPNVEKEKQYPADAAVRHMFHQKFKSGNLKS